MILAWASPFNDESCLVRYQRGPKTNSSTFNVYADRENSQSPIHHAIIGYAYLLTKFTSSF